MRHYKDDEAELLARDIATYFGKISTQEAVTDFVPTGDFYSNGKPIMEQKTVFDKNGAPATVTRWLSPPNAMGLCLHLDIDHETWLSYSCNPAFKEIMGKADTQMKDFWQYKLGTDQNVRAAIYALENTEDKSPKHEVAFGRKTLHQLEVEQMSLQDKLLLVKAIKDEA